MAATRIRSRGSACASYTPPARRSLCCARSGRRSFSPLAAVRAATWRSPARVMAACFTASRTPSCGRARASRRAHQRRSSSARPLHRGTSTPPANRRDRRRSSRIVSAGGGSPSTSPSKCAMWRTRRRAAWAAAATSPPNCLRSSAASRALARSCREAVVSARRPSGCNRARSGRRSTHREARARCLRAISRRPRTSSRYAGR